MVACAPSQQLTSHWPYKHAAGSGWVSLALLQLTDLRSAFGVDLNPHAVIISHANAVLNSFAADTCEPLPARLVRWSALLPLDRPGGPAAATQ